MWDRKKSLKDLNPKDFSLNDGSIRFICALTAELCSQSASSFSRPIRSARVNRPVAAACGSGGGGSSASASLAPLARRFGAALAGAGSGAGTPGSAS